MRAGGNRARLGLAGLALAAGLVACSSRPTSPGPDDAQVRRFASRSYRAESTLNLVTRFERLQVPAGELELSLLRPDGGGGHPLVIYLPGLGEGPQAGAAWRNTWAAAGYAVVTLQREADGPRLWKGPEARSGDFSALARHRFGPARLAERLAGLEQAIGEIERRAREQGGPFSGIDASRIAVAGFELGAQTALAVGGERNRDVPRPTTLAGIRAVIALSPHVSITAGGLADRYGGIDRPTLTVTGEDDEDRYGLGASPSVRLAPFRYMTDGDKYELALHSGGYEVLSGSDGSPEAGGKGPGGTEDGDRPRGGPPGGGMGGPAGGVRGRVGGGMGGGMDGGGLGGRGGPPAGNGPGEPTGGMASGTAADPLRSRIAIQSVTLAFLDATVREDPIATEWLRRNGAPWVEPLGRLSWK